MSWIIINLIEAMLLACFITTFLKNKKDKRSKIFYCPDSFNIYNNNYI